MLKSVLLFVQIFCAIVQRFVTDTGAGGINLKMGSVLSTASHKTKVPDLSTGQLPPESGLLRHVFAGADLMD